MPARKFPGNCIIGSRTISAGASKRDDSLNMLNYWDAGIQEYRIADSYIQHIVTYRFHDEDIIGPSIANERKPPAGIPITALRNTGRQLPFICKL